MAKPKRNKLTSSAINQMGKDLDERVTVYVGKEDYEVDINKYLRKSKIHLLLTEYLVHLQQLKTIDDLEIDTIRDVGVLETGLFLKHFTDLPISDKPLQMIKQVLVLQDKDLIDELTTKFDTDELEKYKTISQQVFSNVRQYGENLGEMIISDMFKGVDFTEDENKEVDIDA